MRNAELSLTLRDDMKKTAVILLFAIFVLASCQKKMEYPVEPKITYQGLGYLMDADSTLTGEVVISIGYTDGDGDLGLDDADTLYPFGPNDPHYYNLIIDYLKWDGSAFVEVPLLSWNQQTQSYDTISFNARFKRLVFNDEEKAISGTIDYKMMVFNPLSPNDTIRFRVRIIDRALHESNAIETGSISFIHSLRPNGLTISDHQTISTELEGLRPNPLIRQAPDRCSSLVETENENQNIRPSGLNAR